MNKINFYNKKVAIISDIHLGLHANSEMWHDIILNYGKWLKDELEKHNIQDLLILGDIFNNREEIGVKTLHVTEQFFKIFSGSNPFNIILLNGNHDSYFRDNSDINSISIFKGWSNIKVVDKVETVLAQGKTFTFIPWGLQDNVPSNNDVLFGHFEINTFKKTVVKMCEDGLDSSVLLDKAKLIMSGHFHLRDERNYKNGKIVYVGCPFQQSWNDANSTKGYFILNTEDLSYEFFENIITPKYISVKLSDFFITGKLDEIKKIIPNNFIKIIVDEDIAFEKFEKIFNILTLLKPLEITSNFSDKTELKVNENYEVVHLDTPILLEEFVGSLDNEPLKDKVLKELTKIYETSLNRVKIEET